MDLKNLIERSGLSVAENVTLARFSTLKVGGPARYFVMPTNAEEICTIQRIASDYGVPLHILSGGSNTLFSDEGFGGIVVKLSSHFDFIEVVNERYLNVGAATSYAKITKLAISLGWAHAVGWSGTPGLVGGALRMNAGTRMGEIKDAFFSLNAIHLGEDRVWQQHDVSFSYRKCSLPYDAIIYKASLAYPEHLVEPKTKLEHQAKEYREKRRISQPATNSLGSFFKNPYPLFAAKLIEERNLKGLVYQGAQISPLHANFIVNTGGATARDILYIASVAQKAVFEHTGVMLVPEIRMVGVMPDLLRDDTSITT